MNLKKLVKSFVSDTLLLGFSLVMLLIFILILLSPNHILVVEESNLVILGFEIAMCVFSVSWAGYRIVIALRRGREQ